MNHKLRVVLEWLVFVAVVALVWTAVPWPTSP